MFLVSWGTYCFAHVPPFELFVCKDCCTYILFLRYTNELPHVTNHFVNMFANDTAAIRTAKDDTNIRNNI